MSPLSEEEAAWNAYLENEPLETQGRTEGYWSSTGHGATGKNDAVAMLNGYWTPCHSSNVQLAAFWPEYQILGIRFGKPGETPGEPYYYTDVTAEMAQSFAEAASKGTWVYNTLRDSNWPFTRAWLWS